MFMAFLFIVFCILYVIVMIGIGAVGFVAFEDERWLVGLACTAIAICMAAYMILWVGIQQDKQNCYVLKGETANTAEYVKAEC